MFTFSEKLLTLKAKAQPGKSICLCTAQMRSSSWRRKHLRWVADRDPADRHCRVRRQAGPQTGNPADADLAAGSDAGAIEDGGTG
jgi:hypothetical protein